MKKGISVVVGPEVVKEIATEMTMADYLKIVLDKSISDGVVSAYPIRKDTDHGNERSD